MKTAAIKNPAFRLLVKGMLSAGVPAVGVGEAYDRRSEVLFLDSRELAEYKVSHLPGAVWVGYNDFNIDRLEGVTLTQPLIVYCTVGKRSDAVTKTLLRAGYTQVQNMAGGIFEWCNQGHAVYCGDCETVDVHAYSAFWKRWLTRGNGVL